MFKSDSQWMTITNVPSNPANNPANNPTDKISNLIEAFTANLTADDKDPTNASTTAEAYRVKGEIGTFIAQKMLKGEKIRIGNNGNLVGSSAHDQYIERRKCVE
jgi:hypothetical protein